MYGVRERSQVSIDLLFVKSIRFDIHFLFVTKVSMRYSYKLDVALFLDFEKINCELLWNIA